MIYEIRVWKDAENMPVITPQAAKSRLGAMKEAIQVATNVASIRQWSNVSANPDIIIDKDGAGDDTIKTVSISTILKDVASDLHFGLNGEEHFSKKIKIIKVKIKGSLYLPIAGGVAEKAATSMLGSQKDENSKKNTLRLWEWAQLQPDAKKEDGYYRGLIISVLTKAGDFRVITANNVYVESYTEDYGEGEFGTFEINLAQRADVTSEVKVEGIDEEQKSVLNQIQDVLDGKSKSKALEKFKDGLAVAGTVAAVAKVGAAVGKKTVETVEKFTGETAATKWIKFGFDRTSDAADITNAGANIAKSAKTDKKATDKAQNISKELGNITDSINKSTQKGYDTETEAQNLEITAAKVKKMEETYLKDLTKEELDVYNRKDNKGKLEMLTKKKEIAEHKIEVAKNQAIIDEYKKELAEYEKKQAAAEELDKQLKEAMLKSLSGGDTSTPSTSSTLSTPSTDKPSTSSTPSTSTGDKK